MNDALVFYEYMSSQYIKILTGFNVQGYYTYKSLDTNRDIFLEFENGQINIGYKGINKMETQLSAILNHKHFDKFFSELIVDTAHDKIYKTYLLLTRQSNIIYSF